MTTAFHRLPGKRPWVLGHRGARHAWPENTLLSFEKALEEGADGVELDVRCDGSGQVIVLHDPTLERVTGGRDRRHVEDVSSAELRRVRLEQDQTVPPLREVLRWAASRRARVNIEVKSDVHRARRLLSGVREVLAEEPHGDYVVLSSFSPVFVAYLARAIPQYPVAWLVHKGQRWLREAPGFRVMGAKGIHAEDALVTTARIVRWKTDQAFIGVWTVNDPARALELGNAGIDCLISDHPRRILDAFPSP